MNSSILTEEIQQALDRLHTALIAARIGERKSNYMVDSVSQEIELALEAQKK